MPTFIKAGFWTKTVKGYKEWLNLDSLIESIAGQTAGAQGPIGPQGATGPAGSQGIQGSQGTQGVPGPIGPAGLTWKSSWVSGTSYILNDAVGYGGASYFNILATSGTTAPNVDTTHWALLASQGAQGVAGATGAQGPVGATGPQGIQGTAGTNGSAGYKAYVAKVSLIGNSITSTVLQNDFVGTTFTWVDPEINAKVRVVATGVAPFTLNKSIAQQFIYYRTSDLYYVTGKPLSPNQTTTFEFTLTYQDFTTTGTPHFQNQIFEIRVYN